jgi:hypothetical protein
MCLGRCPLFESAPVIPVLEKYCIDDPRTGCTKMDYVTQQSQWMQKHKFGVMYPSVLFVESVPVPPVTPTFCKNKNFCANRSAYKNAYQILVLVKNFPKK